MIVKYDAKLLGDTKLDVLKVFGLLIFGTGTKLLLNGGVTVAEGEVFIKSGMIDAVIWGKVFPYQFIVSS